MKTISFLKRGPLVAAAMALAVPGAMTAFAQNAEDAHTRGVDLKGADVRGGDARGGDARGGDVRGGDVTVQGGSATGGSVTGGSVTGGTVTAGSATPGTVTPGTVTASANGRQIQVRAAESASVNVNGSNAEVKLAGQTLRVEKSKLLLDGEPLGDLPPETKKVEVTVKEGMLSVIGDGKEVARAKLNPPPPQ